MYSGWMVVGLVYSKPDAVAGTDVQSGAVRRLLSAHDRRQTVANVDSARLHHPSYRERSHHSSHLISSNLISSEPMAL